MTFGGAYAVLAWVNQQAVDVYGWLTQAETVAGLALAETTPGPLIIVLQFVGFMAGWNQPGALGPATQRRPRPCSRPGRPSCRRSCSSWSARPTARRLASNARLSTALACMTAAVVGVIGSLAIAFGRSVLFPAGFAAPEWTAIGIAVAAFALLQWTKVDAIWIIAGGALLGLALGFV